ncbi:S-layer homology domain-containing protein [Fusibacter bizertensis]|nr:S-layer homology domain-containing protein [Fusibacter bizertensis]
MKFNMKKNGIALVLAALTVTGASFAGLEFKDISGISQENAIMTLHEKGIINGTSSELFMPKKSLKASEGILMIVNTFDLNLDTIRFIKEPKATDYFKNADDTAWYAQGFIAASVNGVELDANLDPNQVWTKEEFIYHIVSTYEQKNDMPMIKITPVEIKDEADITADYSGLLQRALYYGFISLDDMGNLSPKADISRAEAADIMYKIVEVIGKNQ